MPVHVTLQLLALFHEPLLKPGGGIVLVVGSQLSQFAHSFQEINKLVDRAGVLFQSSLVQGFAVLDAIDPLLQLVKSLLMGHSLGFELPVTRFAIRLVERRNSEGRPGGGLL